MASGLRQRAKDDFTDRWLASPGPVTPGLLGQGQGQQTPAFLDPARSGHSIPLPTNPIPPPQPSVVGAGVQLLAGHPSAQTLGGGGGEAGVTADPICVGEQAGA